MADLDSVVSVDKDRKEKTKALSKWMTTNMNDVTPEVAKQYAKKLYDAGVPTVDKLVKKLSKDAAFLRSGKLEMDEDDANELLVTLSRVYNVSFGSRSSLTEEALAQQSGGTSGLAATPVFLSPDFLAADRKDKAEEMVAWYKANTKDITVPNMHVYAYKLYDDNCATVTKIARKMERDPQYLHNMAFDPDDIREIVDSMKLMGMLKSEFQPYDEKNPTAIKTAKTDSFALAAGEGLAARESEAGKAATSHHEETGDFVYLLEVDSSSTPRLQWGQEVVGLFVSVFSDETHTWLDGKIVRFDTVTCCHDVRFPDNFELDIDLNTHLIRIEKSEITTQLTSTLEEEVAVHRAPRLTFSHSSP